MKRLLAICLVLGCALVLGIRSAAAAWPEREIRLIVPYRAGGQSDLTARKLAEVIQKKGLLPQPVVVVNIPGGNTQEGLRTVRSARPDGYTLLLHHSAFITMKELGQISLSWKEFDMVGQALEMSTSLVVNADSPFADASAFIAAVKKEPGRYKAAIPGVGGVAHLALLDVFIREGILDKLEVIPFDGANEAVTALMSGRVDIRVAPNADMARFVKSGEQRVVLVIGDDDLPDIAVPQRAADLGMPTALQLRNGVFAPRNTPAEAKETFARAMREAIASEEFQAFAAQQISTGRFLDAPAWAELYGQDEAIVAELVRHIVKQ